MFHSTGFRLGKRELEILQVVWDLGEATVQNVCDRLQRPAAYSTVLTMTRTLEAKGLLNHRVFGRTFVYRPQVPREEVRAALVHEMREVLFGGSAAMLVSSMLSHGPMSAPELAELREILNRGDAGGDR
jgi:predicted transcriptional regulator